MDAACCCLFWGHKSTTECCEAAAFMILNYLGWSMVTTTQAPLKIKHYFYATWTSNNSHNLPEISYILGLLVGWLAGSTDGTSDIYKCGVVPKKWNGHRSNITHHHT